MKDAKPAELRIYCICGQKMRVKPSMFGQPGKCIACRQKIRIPEAHEVPEGATEMYLRDHPEFLRKPARPPVTPTHEQPPEPPPAEHALGERETEVDPVALDVHVPQQQLWSFETKIARQLRSLKGVTGAEAGSKRDELLRYRGMVRKRREQLEAAMRAKLAEVNTELAEVREELARASLAVRIGDIDFSTYYAQAMPLRKQRERLARQRQNLVGWLAVEDVKAAGGYVDLQLEEIPVKEIAFHMPPVRQSDLALVNACVDNLRRALQKHEDAQRTAAERRLAPAEASTSGNEESADEPELTRARVAVAFHRRRLEEVLQDSEKDIQACESHLELLRKDYASNSLDRAEYQRREIDLLRIQSDNVRASELGKQALQALRSSDVPNPRGTFLRRMAKPATQREIPAHVWVAWLASGFLLMAVFAPLAPTVTVTFLTDRVFAVGLVLAAALMASVVALPTPFSRGIALAVLTTGLALAQTLYFHEAYHSSTPLGAALRLDSHWGFAPGPVLIMLGYLLGLLASLMALIAAGRWRWLPLAALLLTAAWATAILSDFAGAMAPRFRLSEPDFQLQQSSPPQYHVTANLANVGPRVLSMGAGTFQEPNPVEISLERREPSGWVEAKALDAVQVNGQWRPIVGGEIPGALLPPGNTLGLRWALPPGQYRLQVQSQLEPEVAAQEAFILERPAPPEVEPVGESDPFWEGERPHAAGVVGESEPVWEDEPLREGERPQAAGVVGEGDPLREGERPHAAGVVGEGERPREPVQALAPSIEVELVGMARGAGGGPQFVLRLTLPDGDQQQRRVALDEIIYPPWKVVEYNEALRTASISDGDRLIIMRRGESQELPVDPDALPGEAAPEE